MGTGNHGGFGATLGAIKKSDPKLRDSLDNRVESDNDLIDELKKNGTKYNENDIVFIARDKTGQIVWLENGNDSAGLNHILDGKADTPGHAQDFEKAFGIKRNEIGSFLKNAIKYGRVVSNKLIPINNGKIGYERVYEYSGKYYVMTGIGTNGFIVSAYPIRKDDL